MKLAGKLAALAALAALCLSLALQAQIPAGAFLPGAGSHTFQDPAINQGRPLRVFYQVPADCRPEAPVLMVMHGVNRDADRYRDDWKAVAERQGAVLVCPEFSREDFPSDAQYNFGNVYGALRAEAPLPPPLPEAQWTFSCLDPIFEAVAARLKLRTPGYLLYGHSAGAQFVHRLPWFKPGARALRIVSANAGWYMFPDPATAFPYGLGGTGLDEAHLKRVLALPVTVLLGDQDIDPNHPQLRRSAGAMAQGAFRLARGRAYFEAARRQAERLRTPFGWRLVTAPGVPHRDRDMAPFAERELFPEAFAATPLRVLFTGDLGWGESYQDAYEQEGKEHLLKAKGYDHSLRGLAPLLGSARVVVANLETPVAATRASPFTGRKDYVHYADPAGTVPALVRHRIQVVGLANNHTLDQGPEALTQTLANLAAAGVQTFGAGPDEAAARAPWHRAFLVGGRRFSLHVLAAFEYREADYDRIYQFYAGPGRPGVARIDTAVLKAQVEAIRRTDPEAFVVFYPHWGKNYVWRSEAQTATAHAAIDAGVDLVLGHGAHMMGELERYRGRWIAYSLGNFMFNTAGRFVRSGVDPFGLPAVLQVRPGPAGLSVELELHPIRSDNLRTGYQPRPLDAEGFARARALLRERSPGSADWGPAVAFEDGPEFRCVRVALR